MNGFSLICFDFSAQGKSEGTYVTFGLNESEDLDAVINFF